MARGWLGKLWLALSSVLVSLVAAELLARLWLTRVADDEAFRRYASVPQLQARLAGDLQSLSPWAPHRYVGFVPSPGFRRDPNHHDARGFRGAPFPLAKPPGELRIACVGGSTTYSDGVADPAQSYPAQLQRELRRRGHRNVRVINAGASGYTSWETLIGFQLRVLDVDPDVVVVYHGFNDLAGRLVWPPAAYRGDNSGAVRLASNLARETPLLERSTLARIALVRLGRAESHLGLFRNFAEAAPSNRFREFMSQQARGVYPAGRFRQVSAMEMLDRNPPVFFRRNLANLVHVARGNGVAPVLVTFERCDCGRGGVLESPEVRRAIAEHNAVITGLGAELEVPLFDLAGAIPDDPRYFRDAIHFTAEGNRARAVLLAGFLIEQGLVGTAGGTRRP